MSGKLPELLAPAGDFDRFYTALHFGADAVYLAGSDFGLRAQAKNFDADGLSTAVKTAHELGKKVYVTVNIFAKNADFDRLGEYLKYLYFIKADAVIVTDPGVIALAKSVAPRLELHISTQANTLNKYCAKFWAEQGAKRIVLARELTVPEIAEIRDFLPDSTELEAFVHGAMCVSYSGRCLLSNYLSKRDGNKGECVQACRWEYVITEKSRAYREDEADVRPMIIGEDGRGTYLLNSKDLNMIGHLDKLRDAGVSSFKIEGRMKTPYYVATVVNAYRKAIDLLPGQGEEYRLPQELIAELDKASHRDYTTGFYFGEYDSICLDTSKPKCDYEFSADVLGYDCGKKAVIVRQRNRFREGDRLEILSANQDFTGAELHVCGMTDEEGLPVADAKLVQQTLYIPTDKKLEKYDILRMRK